MSFDDAVRALARRKGHNVSDAEPVKVQMTGEWSGYSEYTITNQWDAFTVTCGTFEGVYENEEENRQWASSLSAADLARREAEGGDRYTEPTKTALAKLWDDLMDPS